MKNKVLNALILLLCIFIYHAQGQPYYDTHVLNKYVDANSFLLRTSDTTKLPDFKDIKSLLPQPIWPARQDVIKCYWRTW